jgi:diguanylate cyclase (GGDEF)-like protein
VVGVAGPIPVTISVAEKSAAEYAGALSGQGVAIVVRKDGYTIGSSLPGADRATLPASRGSVTIDGVSYEAVTRAMSGFGTAKIYVTVLSDAAASSSSSLLSHLSAVIFIVAFLVLAFSFSVIASRALQGQIARFLQAARRLAGGDFSSRVPTDGHDEFAALGTKFNNMSEQLERRLAELREERARLRESIRRIGQTFAANLDRPALLELALGTAIDAVSADAGRLSSRPTPDHPLAETDRTGSMTGLESDIYDAERETLRTGELGESSSEHGHVLSVALRPNAAAERVHGVITVARRERPFSDDDRELLRSLARQAALALENVELHHQVQRQAVTDELTGLVNHGRFQQLLSMEIEQVRRYGHPVGLIMLDIDNFKSVNDTYGHPQGDVVLKHVARVVRESSRDADTAARYGGEEMALILPHTDLEGAHAIAKRVRTAIEGLRVPRLDHEGVFEVTASVGVGASSAGDKDELIAETDGGTVRGQALR